MPGEIENMARSMMSSPQGMKIIKGLDKYNVLMNTDGGRQLIAMLAGGGSDALRAAAQASLHVQKDPGRALLQNLLATKEGAALAAKAIEVMGI